jgi:hypothetical protein
MGDPWELIRNPGYFVNGSLLQNLKALHNAFGSFSSYLVS